MLMTSGAFLQIHEEDAYVELETVNIRETYSVAVLRQRLVKTQRDGVDSRDGIRDPLIV